MGGSAEKRVRGRSGAQVGARNQGLAARITQRNLLPLTAAEKENRARAPHHVILTTPHASLHRCRRSPTQPPNEHGGRMAMRLGETKKDDWRRLLCCIVQC
jgi:hypothetical protein